MSRPHRSGSFLVLAILFFLCAFASQAGASSSQSSGEPASADTELICNPSDPQDCYPRIFQPTNEFQVVREDQQLPNGLHVRMNIWTGEKEAKINDPNEADSSLEGLPVDQGMIVVEPQEPEQPQIPRDAPPYEPAGKIKESGPEAGSFANGMKMLRDGKRGKMFDDALEGLEELSHDIYYGLRIAEDPEAVKALFCLMTDHSTKLTPGVTPREQQAAAILGSALQNNPTALKAVSDEWSDFMSSKCSKSGPSLAEKLFSDVVPSVTDDAKVAASVVKARIAAINGLIKDDSIRADFLSKGGMQHLLEVLLPEGKEWAGAQRKAGQLVLDNFLDEDMGAKLGEWPRMVRLSADQCRVPGAGAQEGCWDYHVERIMKANKKDKGHWSRALHDKLAAQKRTPSDGPRSRHEEL